MPLLSINQLSAISGHSHEHVRRTLVNLPSTPGPKGAKLYESRHVLTLRAIGGPTEAESRRTLNDSKRNLIELQAQVIRRERIPISELMLVHQTVFTNLAGILKGRLGKILDDEAMSDLLTELRSLGDGIEELAKPLPIKPAKRKAKR